MIKSTRVEIRFVRKGKKRDTRSDAGAENTHTLVTLRLQPPHRRTRIEHRLSHRLNRATDIRADEMIGAFDLGGLSLLVIRKC